jgi:Protein of unknown function (DUF1360)
MDHWSRLIVAVLATWRITHLLANEDGPADLFVRLRAKLGNRLLGKMLDCFQCLSLWVAFPLALFITRRPVDLLFTWFALSGAACLLERLGQEPVVIEPIVKAEEGRDVGMLRPGTSGYQEQFADDDSRRHATSI